VRPGDWVLSVSEATRADLCARFTHIDPARVVVVPPAASRDFCPRSPAEVDVVRCRYGVPDGARYLLTLNTLEPRKNVDHVLRCFTRVIRQERIDDLYLVMAGGKGWLYGQILDSVNDATIRGRVLVAGFVPDADLAPLYTGATAFVYPSLYEGFGLPPLEAMACGAPVIASDNSSLPEVVGRAGILVPATDADALCGAMLRVAGDDTVRLDLGRRGIARAAAFSWEACVNRTLAAYGAALAE
jgi:glycosyltransferase involved in cell wall biosynthesis